MAAKILRITKNPRNSADPDREIHEIGVGGGPMGYRYEEVHLDGLVFRSATEVERFAEWFRFMSHVFPYTKDR